MARGRGGLCKYTLTGTIGTLTIVSQLWVDVVQHGTPSALLVGAGCLLLGVVLPGFWFGDRHAGVRIEQVKP
jgi:hypothetical protein